MRVTNNSILNNLINDINRNRTRWADLQRQVSTQQRVEKPSDDALAYASGNEAKSAIDQNEQYMENIDSGLEQARFGQDALQQMVERLAEFRRVATYGANGSALSASDRETLADNVGALSDQIKDLANTNYKGRYLFAGTQTTTEPFQEDGSGTVQYEGNNDPISVKINNTTSVDISLSGDNLFTYDGAESVFDLLDRVEQNLRNNDSVAVNADLENISNATEYVSNRTSDLATQINRLEFSYNQYESQNITLSEGVSRALDTDFAEALSEITQLDTAYQAALSTTARIGRLSLANYL